MNNKKSLTSHYFIGIILTVIFIVIATKLKAQIMFDSLNNLKVGINYKPTKYKSGFEYTTNHQEKAILLKWVYSHNEMGIKIYRWRVKIKKFGISAIVWTDDCWIDLSTNKAYLDKQKNEIIYYFE